MLKMQDLPETLGNDVPFLKFEGTQERTFADNLVAQALSSPAEITTVLRKRY